MSTCGSCRPGPSPRSLCMRSPSPRSPCTRLPFIHSPSRPGQQAAGTAALPACTLPACTLPTRTLQVCHRLVCTLLATALLAGCGSLLPPPAAPPVTYTLEADPEAGALPPAAAASAPTLAVSALQAAAGYDSPRIVYLRQPQQLEAYAQSVWVDTPARLLAPLLVAALQRSGGFAAVVSAPSAAASTLRLDTELLRLRQDFEGGSSAVTLSLRATLVDGATRQVLGSRDFSATVPAASADSAGGVRAAQRATRQVLGPLAAWCAAAANRTGSRTPR